MTEVRGEYYVELKGTIPVTVQVCLTEDDGHVNRVIAWDNDFKYDAPTETSEEDADEAALRGRAHEVAEASMWPAWEWGN